MLPKASRTEIGFMDTVEIVMNLEEALGSIENHGRAEDGPGCDRRHLKLV
jgi:hypothetical protein